MLRFLCLAVLLLAAGACAPSILVSVRDTDTRGPLAGVRVVAEIDGRRTELGETDARGTCAVPVAWLRGQLLFFKNYYRKLAKPGAEFQAPRVTLDMTEGRKPDEVTKLRVEETDGRRRLAWNRPLAPDTAGYTVHLRRGLEEKDAPLATGLTDTWLDLDALAPDVDYRFRVTARDRHGNENRGAELDVFVAPPAVVLPATSFLSGRVTGAPAGVPVIVDCHPVNLGPWGEYPVEAVRVRAAADGTWTTPALPAGRWAVTAFADLHGDGAWSGHWLGRAAEPRAAARGVAVAAGATARVDLALAVPAAGLPRPVFDEEPGLVDLYDAAWGFARHNVKAGNTSAGFVPAFMDEGFNDHIYQWDSCFIVRFGIYGGAEFPAMASLDNFYRKQRANGFICRVQDEKSGRDYSPEKRDPHLNPPLFAWAELAWYRLSGDETRLLRALRHNDRFFRWIKANCRTAEGYYFTSNLGSGMDNSPREGQAHGWIDMTSQMALAARCLAELADAAGLADLAARYRAEHATIADLVNTRMWDEKTGLYFDVRKDGALHRRQTIASFWPLVAGIAPAGRASRLAAHLADPRSFGLAHPFPTLAKSDPEYDPKGYYWRGAAWAPTTGMAVKGLEATGRGDFARTAARAHLAQMLAVWRDFVPEKRKLPYGNANIPFPAELDGTRQIWECYAPEKAEPATRWDNQYYVRPRFVGWSGLGPIALLIENVIGIRGDAPRRRIVWELGSRKTHGVRGLAFAGGRVDLVCRERGAGEPVVDVTSDVDFTLELRYDGKTSERVVRAARR